MEQTLEEKSQTRKRMEQVIELRQLACTSHVIVVNLADSSEDPLRMSRRLLSSNALNASWIAAGKNYPKWVDASRIPVMMEPTGTDGRLKAHAAIRKCLEVPVGWALVVSGFESLTDQTLAVLWTELLYAIDRYDCKENPVFICVENEMTLPEDFRNRCKVVKLI